MQSNYKNENEQTFSIQDRGVEGVKNDAGCGSDNKVEVKEQARWDRSTNNEETNTSSEQAGNNSDAPRTDGTDINETHADRHGDDEKNQRSSGATDSYEISGTERDALSAGSDVDQRQGDLTNGSYDQREETAPDASRDNASPLIAGGPGLQETNVAEQRDRDGAQDQACATGGQTDANNADEDAITRTTNVQDREDLAPTGTESAIGAQHADVNPPSTDADNERPTTESGSDGLESANGTHAKKAGLSDKIVGGAEKIAGRVTKNPDLREHGEDRKAGIETVVE